MVAMDRNGRQDKLVILLVFTQNTIRGHHPRFAGERLAFKQIKIVLLFGVGGWSVSGWSGEGALSCPLERLTTTREAGEVADTGDVVWATYRLRGRPASQPDTSYTGRVEGPLFRGSLGAQVSLFKGLGAKGSVW